MSTAAHMISTAVSPARAVALLLLDETHVASRRGVALSVATRKEDGDVSIRLGSARRRARRLVLGRGDPRICREPDGRRTPGRGRHDPHGRQEGRGRARKYQGAGQCRVPGWAGCDSSALTDKHSQSRRRANAERTTSTRRQQEGATPVRAHQAVRAKVWPLRPTRQGSRGADGHEAAQGQGPRQGTLASGTRAKTRRPHPEAAGSPGSPEPARCKTYLVAFYPSRGVSRPRRRTVRGHRRLGAGLSTIFTPGA